MFDLSGKTALVTGASGGIGNEIANLFHKNGANVVISGTNEDKLKAVQATLGEERCKIVAANLSDRAEVEQLAAKATEAFGQIDILVCNAGITKDMLTMRMKDEDWDAVINVNLSSSFVLIRALMKGMIKRRGGRIINISSIVGTSGNPGQANYSASKAGMIAMTKSIALETANRGITANSIAPGFIETPMTEKLNEKQREAMLGAIPSGKFGQVQDIAAACLYLASDQAGYVTGQTIHINGGMLMV